MFQRVSRVARFGEQGVHDDDDDDDDDDTERERERGVGFTINALSPL